MWSEPTIYNTQGEHTNHYTAVVSKCKLCCRDLIYTCGVNQQSTTHMWSEPTIYNTQGEHTNHYTAVVSKCKLCCRDLIYTCGVNQQSTTHKVNILTITL